MFSRLTGTSQEITDDGDRDLSCDPGQTTPFCGIGFPKSKILLTWNIVSTYYFQVPHSLPLLK